MSFIWQCSRCNKHFYTNNGQAILCVKCANEVAGQGIQEYEKQALDALEDDPYVIRKRAELRALLRRDE